MGRPIAPAATDQSTIIRILDSTTFLPEEAVEHTTTGIALWYRREGATKTAITPAALAALDTAHSDGGIEHIDDGYYRLDLPDAAVAAGADGVAIGGTFTDMIVIGNYHPLNFIQAAGIESEVDDALVARGLHKLVATSATGTDIADDSIIAQLVSKSATADWDDYDNTTDSLQANRDNIGTTGAAMTVAAVTGAVGSVTGNVGGNVTGSVGSVTGLSVTDILTTQMTESYAADGTAPTLAQALFLIQQSIGDFSISGTTITVKKLDGSSTAATYTLDSSTLPTSRTRSV